MVAKWLKISAKWCSFGLAGLVKLSCENVFALRKEIMNCLTFEC